MFVCSIRRWDEDQKSVEDSGQELELRDLDTRNTVGGFIDLANYQRTYHG